MSAVLHEAGIEINSAWCATHVPRDAQAVIVGPLVSRRNVELEEAMQRDLPTWNSTAFLEEYFLRYSENFVIAGTKGKTTTAAMLAWILQAAGKAPDYMIGGQVRSTDWSRVALARSRIMVLEGDEYRCGYGDPLPKFNRYHARHLLVTNIVHDHLDMFPTPQLYRDAFMHLVCALPKNGTLTINADDPSGWFLASLTPTPVQSVGFSSKANFRITGLRETGKGVSFRMGGVGFKLGLSGRTNAMDAALASVISAHAGVSLPQAAHALGTFPGVEGRLEKVAAIGRTLIYTDEAYLPIAIGPLLKALRHKHPGRRIVFIFEPRHTGGGDDVCQKVLPVCLAHADLVITGPSFEAMDYGRPFDHRRLCRDVSKLNTEAVALKNFEDLQAISQQISHLIHDGDIVLISLPLHRTGGATQIVHALRQHAELRSDHE